MDENEKSEEKCACGEELDKNCMGQMKCPVCNPCPCCSDTE